MRKWGKAIDLIFDSTTCQTVRQLRARYSPRPQYWKGPGLLFRLPHELDDVYIESLEKIAEKHSLFAVKIVAPFRSYRQENNMVAFELASSVMKEIQQDLNDSLAAVVVKEWRKIQSMIHRPMNVGAVQLTGFRPRVGVRYKMQEEEAEKFLNELRTEYPDGLGTAKATGLSLRELTLSNAMAETPVEKPARDFLFLKPG